MSESWSHILCHNDNLWHCLKSTYIEYSIKYPKLVYVHTESWRYIARYKGDIDYWRVEIIPKWYSIVWSIVSFWIFMHRLRYYIDLIPSDVLHRYETNLFNRIRTIWFICMGKQSTMGHNWYTRWFLFLVCFPTILFSLTYAPVFNNALDILSQAQSLRK